MVSILRLVTNKTTPRDARSEFCSARGRLWETVDASLRQDSSGAKKKCKNQNEEDKDIWIGAQGSPLRALPDNELEDIPT